MLKLYLLFTVLILLNACQAAKDGLTGKKRSTSDEFLVEKKNPLTLPPEFGKLPEPIENLKEEDINEEDFDIRKLLGNLPKNENEQSNSSGLNKSLESSILKKINKN